MCKRFFRLLFGGLMQPQKHLCDCVLFKRENAIAHHSRMTNFWEKNLPNLTAATACKKYIAAIIRTT